MIPVNPNDAYAEWLDSLAAAARFGSGDKNGTANLIDDAAGQRAADAIRTGRSVSLARPLEIAKGDDLPVDMLSVEVALDQSDSFPNRPPFSGGQVHTGFDIAHIAAHGQRQTHLDALNHIGRHGTWYGGFPVDDPTGPSVADLANHKLFTRGILVDVPAIRGTEWVDPDHPVTGEDIEAALTAGEVTFQPGDALLLYMGRDLYEASGKTMDLAAGVPTPGAAASAARWIAEHSVSIVCWDFADAVAENEPVLQLHMLIWAIGLVLVDYCHLGPAAQAARHSGLISGGLVVAPPAIPRATGSLVNPLFIQ